MNKHFTILCAIICVAFASTAQRVGVVLSGGGAKGLAHVGVLKALEENEIPIDYVTGTSMGGIIAGSYAAGMSPDQIEDIVLSEELLRWINGKQEEDFNYFYSKKDDHPSFIKVNLSLDSTFSFLFNSSIASDQSLNFALAEKFALPSSVSKNNFDSLMVPLRVVAADVFTQNEVVLSSGVLSDALRATQTVPFFYNPIKVENKYLFDGGVYNNFPVDVMQEDFNPDIIIGSNVSTKIFEEYPYDEDEKLISKSLLYLLLDKSDPSQIPEGGIYIQPNLAGYTALDFTKAKSLVDSGYVQTMRQMDEIKEKVEARRTCESVAITRNIFNSKAKPLLIEEIQYEGFNSRQQRYLNKYFDRGRRPLYYSDVKKGYFKIVSEDYFRNVYPNILYDTAQDQYNFKLSRRPNNNFQVDFGGVIATRSVSNIFLGLNYYYFNRALINSTLNFYAGNFYKSIEAKFRIDMPRLGQFYVEPEAVVNNWDFLQGKDIIVTESTPTVLSRIDRKVGVSIGFPAGRHFKTTIRSHYVNNNDRYINSAILNSSDTLDNLKLSGFRTGISFSSNSLNRKQYASEGRHFEFSGDWFSMNEHFMPGTTSIATQSQDNKRSWVRARFTLEQYFKAGIYSSGYYVDGVFSNQPLFTNYQGSLINAPAFYPLQDSKTLFLQNFRAFNFVSGGWRNVFNIRNNLDFRLEGYVFKPFEAIVAGQNQEAVLDDDFSKIFFAGTAGMVFHSTIGPISLSFNYYDDSENQFGVLLHVGFLLFNKSSMD
ncbi:MAG: patatin-like phospholipase family protein [Cyclobacteriaceae bacterium]